MFTKIVFLAGQLRSLHIHTRSDHTTEEGNPLLTTDPEGLEELEELADVAEDTLEMYDYYDDNFPSLFGRVTPTRIQETLHELTTLKGVDGKSVKYFSQERLEGTFESCLQFTTNSFAQFWKTI